MKLICCYSSTNVFPAILIEASIPAYPIHGLVLVLMCLLAISWEDTDSLLA